MNRRDALPPEQAGLFAPQTRRASASAAERAARRLTEAYPPPASPHHVGSSGGLHPEDAPYTSQEVRPPRAQRPMRFDDDADEDLLDGDDLPPRSHSSARRYASSPAPATAALPERTRLLPHPPRQPFRAHGLLLVGLALVVMLLGWMAFTALGSWWQLHQDDATYGRPRTFQADAVVGHNADSQQHPSHFLALNLHRQVIVIELPADDPAKALIYTAGTLLGDGQDLAPVTLSFEDRNGDGRPDLNIHIGDQVVVFLNTGQKFVAAQQH